MGLTSILINPEEKYWTKSSTLLMESRMFCHVICFLKGTWSKLVLNWQSKGFPLLWMLSNILQ